jgi:serine/threonine protein kinase/tetratricopeptide (TPR) repeat protein
MADGGDRRDGGGPDPSVTDDATLSTEDSAASDDTLSVPAGDTSTAERRDRIAPAAIAGYRIVGLLGEGGMGVVWEAEQERPRRRVALKVMRRDHVVDELHSRLFFREAETLARLKHPNIAAIYESGHTDDGHDFFAMELVAGMTLDEWLQSRPATIGADELKLRLRLFGALCDAVHYAHQRGVIHRDLKPSNIIVAGGAGSSSGGTSSTGGPMVKILDFGLARITDSDVAATLVSEVGVIKGTLQYMSPEQARGDVAAIDVRSDVYALGMILYELLAGQRPYDVSRSALAEAVRVICEDRPKPLRQSWKGSVRLDADLETIIGKALEKEMDRRYDSAAALGNDVTRHLASQPIQARPPSAAYQMRKFATRNRALVGAAAATLLVIIAGAAVSTTFGLREAAQRREAERARADLQVVTDFQSRMLAEIDPGRMGRDMVADLRERIVAFDGDASGAGADAEEAAGTFDELILGVNTTDAALTIIDRQVLQRALETIDSEFADRPEIGLRLRTTLGDTYGKLGLLAEAEAQARLVHEGWRRLRGPEHPDTLEAGRRLAQELLFLGRYEEAETLLTGVLDSQARALGDFDPATLRSRSLLADLWLERGQVDEAEGALEEVLAEQRRSLGVEHADTMRTMNALAMLYSDEGGGDGEALMRELLDTATRVWGDEDARALVYEHNLARILQREGRNEEALGHNRHVLEARRRVLGDDHPRTLRTKANVADSLSRLGRFDESRELFAEVYEDRLRTLGPDHPDTIETIGSLAIVTKNLGRFTEAAPLYEATLAGRTRLFGAEHPRTLATQYGLADLFWKMGRTDDAERLLLATIDSQQRVLGPDNRQTLRSRVVLAGLLGELGRDREAEQLYLDAGAAQLEALGESDPEAIWSLLYVAEFYIRGGRHDDAEAFATRGRDLGSRALGDDNPVTLRATFDLAWVRTKQRRYDEAEALYEEVLAVQERTLGRDHVDTANTLQNIGCVLRDAGRYDEARAFFEEVRVIQETAWGPDHRWVAGNLEDYAKLLRLMGEDDKAAVLEARVRRIRGS